MNQLAGTVGDILYQLDRSGRDWRSGLRDGSEHGINPHVERVTLPDKRVFYVEEARPEPSVSVVFVSPTQQG